MPYDAPVLVLTRADVERLLDIDAMLDALERAFVALSRGDAIVPPRIAAFGEHGGVAAMPGWLPGVALEVKLVSVFPDNHRAGKPSHQGLIALFDEGDGTPIALMDAIHITAMRTAGGAAVSVRALARRGSAVLAILGAGTQGASHLQTVPRVMPELREIRIASRTLEHAAGLASQRPDAAVAESFEAAVRGADVVCCCTDAREPILRAEWLAPGTHITAVGGTFGPELDAATVQRARIFVEWRGAAEHPPPAGAHELQGVDPQRITEVGAVLSGQAPGRRTDTEITVYKSTGHAVEDAAAARMVYDRARAEGAGREVRI